MSHSYKSTLYACYISFITQAAVNTITPLLFIIFQNEFGISFEMLGRLVVFNFGVQIFADLVGIRIADKIGSRIMLVLAHFLCAAGLIGLGILPKVLQSPYTGLEAAAIVYAVGSGFIEVMINPVVISLPGNAKASTMSLVHSFYCWGQVLVISITTLLIKVLGAKMWFVLPVMWAIVPIYNLFRFMKVPLTPLVEESERTTIKRLFSSRTFVFILIMMICAGSSEQTMAQWASIFAEKGLQVPKLVGDLLGPGLFAVLMGIGRIAGGVVQNRLRLKKALIASSALCGASYAVVVFIRIPYISLFGCALCGFSVSLLWPGTLSLAAGVYTKGGTTMFGLLAIFGAIGASIGPWLAGIISDLAKDTPWLVAMGEAHKLNTDQLGLKTGLLTAMIFPLILIVLLLLVKSERTA